jgi:hypothetical protein
MYKNISTTESFPKTLVVRNTPDGMIWQIYHVKNQNEAEKLAVNATSNGFYGITLEDYQPEHVETWPGWRVNADPAIIGENYEPTEQDIDEYNERMQQEQEKWERMFPYED